MTRSVRGDLLVGDKEFPRDCKVDTLERSTRRIYLLNRYYDPSTDQFLSVDPDVQTTDQPYVYTGDDPLNRTDPLGLGPQADSALLSALKELLVRESALKKDATQANMGLLKVRLTSNL